MLLLLPVILGLNLGLIWTKTTPVRYHSPCVSPRTNMRYHITTPEIGIIDQTAARLPVAICWARTTTRFMPHSTSLTAVFTPVFTPVFTHVFTPATLSPRTPQNVGLLAYSPLAGGILTGKYAAGDSAAVEKAR